MVTNKRKKMNKYRGYTTHGGGHRKKRRGAGNRGGRGNAGSGKKGKAKKQSSPKLGGKGFSSIMKQKIKTINISELNNLITKNELKNPIDLGALGFNKLLGTGSISTQVDIKITNFSKTAEEKIKKVGGSIINPQENKVKKPEE